MKKQLILLIGILSITFLNAQTRQDTIDHPYWQGMMSNFKVNFYDTKRAYDLYFSNKPKEKGSGYKIFERWADYWKRVINKDGSFKPNDYVEKQVRHFKLNNNASRSSSGAWTSLGPFKEPAYGKWAGGDMTSAGTGRLNVLAIHPTNSNIMYAGAPQGGLWKTINGGTTWTQLTNLASNGISAIALFPNDVNRILVGTGDRDAGDAQGRGLYLSTNGGTNFTFVPVTGMAGNGDDLTINKIIVNPINSNTLLATSSSAMLKSVDQGNTWTFTNLNTSFLDVAYCPNDTNTIYLTPNKNDPNTSDFFLSTDGGTSYNISNTGINVKGINRSFISTTAANPNFVYMIRVFSKNMEGFYKSTDKGQSWTRIIDHNNFNLMGSDPLGKDSLKGQGFYDVAIYADNVNANRIIVGGVNLFESTDGGANWTMRTCWNGCNSLPTTHADNHYITKNTTNNTFYICNDGGLYKTLDFVNFTPIYDGMVISQFYDIDVSMADKDRVVGGLQDNSMVELKNNNWLTHLGGDGMFAEVSDFDLNLMVGSSQNGGLEMTTDGFATSALRINNGTGYGIDEDGPWVTPFQMSPFNDNIFVGGFKTKIFYTKGLRSLEKNAAIPTSTNSFIGLQNGADIDYTAVRFSRKDSNYCFIGSSKGNIYYFKDIASNTSPLLSTCISPNAGININDIETSAKNVGTLWVATGDNVYRSNDTGKTWTDITYNLPAIKKFTLVSDKNTNFEDLYVGTEGGVYVLQAGSPTNWVLFSTNLPAFSHVRDLEIWYDTLCHSSSILLGGTYGSGLWKSDLYRSEDVNFTIAGNATPAVSTATSYSATFPNSLLTSKAKWTVTPSAGVNFSNNNSDTISPNITFANLGIYALKVKAYNSLGGFCRKSINITVGTAAPLAIKVTSSSVSNNICQGDSVILSANGGNSYSISPTTNTRKINDSTFSVNPGITTKYVITGTDAFSQTNKDSITITVFTKNPGVSISRSGNILTASTDNVNYQWLKCLAGNQFQSILGSTTKTYSVSQDGNYAVEVSNLACRDTSTCFNYITTSILNSSNIQLSAFPNPANKMVYLKFGNTIKNATLELFDHTGRKLDTKGIKNLSELEYNIEKYAQGIYFIKIYDSNMNATIKIIKE